MYGPSSPSSLTLPATRSERILDPVARTSEVLFGLIMALTFTGTLSAATAGREDIRALLVGMIGCNLAWGLVDAVMFLVSTLAERGQDEAADNVMNRPSLHGFASLGKAHTTTRASRLQRRGSRKRP